MRAENMFLGIFILALTHAANAQVSVNLGGQDVRVGGNGSVSIKGTGAQVSIGSDNQVGSSVGSIAPDANIEGVTIINGKLWIDGYEVPPSVKTYKSPKTGKTYKIDRKGKNVSVAGSD
jgi:hypothetical protein